MERRDGDYGSYNPDEDGYDGRPHMRAPTAARTLGEPPPAAAAPPADGAPATAPAPGATPAPAPAPAPPQSGGGSAQSVTQAWQQHIAPAAQQPAPDMPQIAARNPEWDKFYQQLASRSNQSLKVDPNDPIIRNQVDAAKAVGNRETQQNIQAAAERGGIYATGATANYARHAQEEQGGKLAMMQGELMNRELTSRRQEIAQALSGMQGMLTEDEKSRLHQQDQALQAKQIQLGAQQNAWENEFKQHEALRQSADAAAGRNTSANIAGSRLAFDQEEAKRAQGNWQENFNAALTQQNLDNDYRVKYGQ